MDPLSLEQLTANLPRGRDVEAEVVARTGCPVLLVLDDDPTGTQSVADLPVITAWQVDDLAWALSTGARAVYVMTNSRSLSPADAERVNREVVTNGLEAARRTDRTVAFVSRSDSTLRGHFPLEPDVIASELTGAGQRVDGVIIVPAFPDAGRITVDSTHYAGSPADGYMPVGQTEFAQDATFGYRSSYLPDWVAEKSSGQRPADTVLRVTLAQIRTDQEAVVTTLRHAHDRQPIVVDCVEENDLRLFSLALARAEEGGQAFIYRVGPPFVRARIGQQVHPPLTAEQSRPAPDAVASDAAGGLIVVGSHVGVTGRQLDALRERLAITTLTIDVPTVLDPDQREAHLHQIVARAARELLRGSVVIQTSRQVVTGADADDSLRIARDVSAALVSTVAQALAARAPRFVIAKGGITSSDVASKGLGIRHATVRGPMLPGIVSMWQPADGPARGIPYIVFAGNVGSDDSLAEVVEKLQSTL
ncbi:four-carbon acid sugar kinase family protein [Acidipropionibacterium thoenii]|uniref:four-carbon acid sugar kinase family protein n=1 Tax=Acidipropionibacterium thoenii TaxID=1751 RepID=UPI0004199C6A|nr:four-carbon acid sugar kinase family protein [Acidipropionibacterium thoenii]